MGQIVSIVSGKGGTGKTTFTALLGASLARLGWKTLLIDCDVGLRNLDLALGMSDCAVMDFSDIVCGRASLKDAAVHPKSENLFFLTAPVEPDDATVSEEQMKQLLDTVRGQFDFCLIDAPAGLGPAFRLASCGADRVIVVSNTDATALRDAQHTVMLLAAVPQVHLVVNRLRRKLLRFRNVDDAIDAAGLPLLGILPDDKSVPVALERGELGFSRKKSPALIAAGNVARRLCGESVPLMKL